MSRLTDVDYSGFLQLECQPGHIGIQSGTGSARPLLEASPPRGSSSHFTHRGPNDASASPNDTDPDIVQGYNAEVGMSSKFLTARLAEAVELKWLRKIRPNLVTQSSLR